MSLIHPLLWVTRPDPSIHKIQFFCLERLNHYLGLTQYGMHLEIHILHDPLHHVIVKDDTVLPRSHVHTRPPHPFIFFWVLSIYRKTFVSECFIYLVLVQVVVFSSTHWCVQKKDGRIFSSSLTIFALQLLFAPLSSLNKSFVHSFPT